MLAPGSCFAEMQIGPWRVLDKVGSGTYGTVFRVEHVDRPEAGIAALKLVHHPEDERFEREAELLSRTESPHTPKLHDFGQWTSPEGEVFPYLVIDYIEGEPLYEYARRRQLSSRQVIRLVAQVARALEAIHRHGTHRDVKGDNILVRKDGHAFLTDFGCGWYVGARPLTDGVIPPGTRPYRSHQVLRFQYTFRRDAKAHYKYKPQDDIYALGVTTYRLVTGTYPPPGTDPECAMDPDCPRPPPVLPPRDLANVCPELDALILQMLSGEPERRGSAEELVQALEETGARAGRRANLPITPSPSAAPTQHTSHPGPPSDYDSPPIIKVLASALVATTLCAGTVLVFSSDAPHSSSEPWNHAPYRTEDASLQRDGGTTEVADAAVYSSVIGSAAPYVSAPEPWPTISLAMPDHPLPGQMRAPCKQRGQVEINGGCWVRVVDIPPPCERDAYEWKNSCYWPIRTSEHPNTSTK